MYKIHLLLQDVPYVYINKDTLTDGSVLCNWNHGVDRYAVQVKITNKIANNPSRLFSNLQDEEWCNEKGYSLIYSAPVSTLIGEGYAFTYSAISLNTPMFVCYVDIDVDSLMSLEVQGSFTFQEAMEMFERVISDGVSIIKQEVEVEE